MNFSSLEDLLLFHARISVSNKHAEISFTPLSLSPAAADKPLSDKIILPKMRQRFDTIHLKPSRFYKLELV